MTQNILYEHPFSFNRNGRVLCRIFKIDKNSKIIVAQYLPPRGRKKHKLVSCSDEVFQELLSLYSKGIRRFYLELRGGRISTILSAYKPYDKSKSHNYATEKTGGEVYGIE
jgi:hypothetical protein